MFFTRNYRRSISQHFGMNELCTNGENISKLPILKCQARVKGAFCYFILIGLLPACIAITASVLYTTHVSVIFGRCLSKHNGEIPLTGLCFQTW